MKINFLLLFGELNKRNKSTYITGYHLTFPTNLERDTRFVKFSIFFMGFNYQDNVFLFAVFEISECYQNLQGSTLTNSSMLKIK